MGSVTSLIELLSTFLALWGYNLLKALFTRKVSLHDGCPVFSPSECTRGICRPNQGICPPTLQFTIVTPFATQLIWCLLIAYPLGSLFIRLPSSQPSLKHAFNIFVSVFFFIPVLHLQWGFLQLLASILGTYFIAANVRGSSMPWIVFMQV